MNTLNIFPKTVLNKEKYLNKILQTLQKPATLVNYLGRISEVVLELQLEKPVEELVD